MSQSILRSGCLSDCLTHSDYLKLNIFEEKNHQKWIRTKSRRKISWKPCLMIEAKSKSKRKTVAIFVRMQCMHILCNVKTHAVMKRRMWQQQQQQITAEKLTHRTKSVGVNCKFCSYFLSFDRLIRRTRNEFNAMHHFGRTRA